MPRTRRSRRCSRPRWRRRASCCRSSGSCWSAPSGRSAQRRSPSRSFPSVGGSLPRRSPPASCSRSSRSRSASPSRRSGRRSRRPGVPENPRGRVVRPAEGVVYIASVDDDGYGDRTPAELHMYRATTAGIPTAFTSADAGDDPRADELSGGDARIDAAGTIHLTYVVADSGSLTVRYQTFDTRSDEWGPSQDVARLDGAGDGVRGRVVSALALDRAGKPLVATASPDGVSAWTRAGDGA